MGLGNGHQKLFSLLLLFCDSLLGAMDDGEEHTKQVYYGASELTNGEVTRMIDALLFLEGMVPDSCGLRRT